MKRVFLVLISAFFTLVHNGVKAQEVPKVLDLMRIQEKAWNEGNLEEFMKPYIQGDSLMFIGSKGITYGWKNALERYKTSYPDKASMGELSFTIIKAEQLS